MGFEYEDVRLLLWALKGLETRHDLLILGDAVFHFDARTLVGLAKSAEFTLASGPETLDSFSFGASLGFARTETLDVNGRASLQVDLHQAPPQELLDGFDCVIDAGVLFWCFDPAAAFKSILKMVRPGGMIVHITAISGHYGRGYYNVHPLAFEDFYLLNNCQFVGASFRTRFHVWPLANRILRKLGLRNRVSYVLEPGSAYLAESSFNRISFADSFREPFERNMLPNNAVGVLTYRKLANGEIRTPVRTALYTREEAAERRMRNAGFAPSASGR